MKDRIFHSIFKKELDPTTTEVAVYGAPPLAHCKSHWMVLFRHQCQNEQDYHDALFALLDAYEADKKAGRI